MAEKNLDQKIAETTGRISFLKKELYQLPTDAQIAIDAYNAAMNAGDSAGADINRNSNVAINAKIVSYKDELAMLTTTLAALNSQKQIVLNAQQKIVSNTLTPEQQASIKLAEIKAAQEVSKANAIASASQPVDNTKKYLIIGSIVLVVLVVVAVIVVKLKKS